MVSLAKVINERLGSCMQIITLMLSAMIIYPSHQFVSVFSLRHVGPLRLQPVLVKRRNEDLRAISYTRCFPDLTPGAPPRSLESVEAKAQ
jgi:hypothetical protein